MISAGPAAQPSRNPGQKILENVPACSTMSGASAHRLGGGACSKLSSRYAKASRIRKPYRRASATSSCRRGGGIDNPPRFWEGGGGERDFRPQPSGRGSGETSPPRPPASPG